MVLEVARTESVGVDADADAGRVSDEECAGRRTRVARVRKVCWVMSWLRDSELHG